MGVQRHTVSHFKGLINAKVDLEAQGRDISFIMGHTHLKKAVLYRKNCDRSDIFLPHCRFLHTLSHEVDESHDHKKGMEIEF